MRPVTVSALACLALSLTVTGVPCAQPSPPDEPPAVTDHAPPAPPASPAPPAPPASPAPPSAPEKAGVPPPPPHREAGPLVNVGPNVRVDVTIKDHRPESPVVTKLVSVVVADTEEGRVRTTVSPRGRPPAPLNVDARPVVQSNGRILLRLALQYDLGLVPQDAGAPAQEGVPIFVVPSGHSSVNETIAVVLDNAKPMVVTQSADPLTERKVTVEVTATILK